LQRVSLEHLDMADTQLNLSANPHFLAQALATAQTVILSRNHLQSDTLSTLITDNTTKHEVVKELVLDGNSLNAVPVQVLAVAPMLETCSLQGNVIRLVERGAFHENQRLRQLNLANNSLSVLADGAFFGLNSSLKHLNISSNVIRLFSIGVFNDTATWKNLL